MDFVVVVAAAVAVDKRLVVEVVVDRLATRNPAHKCYRRTCPCCSGFVGLALGPPPCPEMGIVMGIGTVTDIENEAETETETEAPGPYTGGVVAASPAMACFYYCDCQSA